MTNEPNELTSVSRRQASSRNVDFGNPVVIHETSQQKIHVVPFFIRRSNGTDLSVKIEVFTKSTPPSIWVLNKTRSISLNESAARQLMSALRTHFAVAEQDETGDYIVIRVDDGSANFDDIDTLSVTQALIGVLSRPDITQHLNNLNLSDELANAFRSAIRLREMQSAMATLRQHLYGGDVSEQIYQEWCQNHSWAFGNAYVMSDTVRNISATDRLDLLMPTVITGYRDIVELKRPNMEVIFFDSSHSSYYFSADVSKAIGQIHRYLDVLHDVAANGLRDNPEIVAYHPRAVLVIGRSADWEPEKHRALHGLNQRLSGITVMTYDQLLSQGERLIEIFSAEHVENWDESNTSHS